MVSYAGMFWKVSFMFNLIVIVFPINYVVYVIYLKEIFVTREKLMDSILIDM